jgi:hypothetical protein
MVNLLEVEKAYFNQTSLLNLTHNIATLQHIETKN